MIRFPIALTCGEPAGVAPEITGIGDAALFEERCAKTGIPLTTKRISRPSDASGVFASALPVINLPFASRPMAGRIDSGTADTVIESINEAVGLAIGGEVSAVVTNPVQKEALYRSGFRHQGHTDYLAHLARLHGREAHDVMMLVADGLRAIPVTVHIPLADVPSRLSSDEIAAQGRIVARELTARFGIAKPRIAVTGLNPHAGENGAMGDEEITIIAPAIAQLRSSGIDVRGPVSADTAFHPEARRTYDAILCMYHDQALIPVKTLDFHGGVNVTLGLPFVRTSPDHGTALELAGSNRANPSSLIAAIRLAARMTHNAR
jgi:4-hydroxythreonine-4-phosphate dehydrogenase